MIACIILSFMAGTTFGVGPMCLMQATREKEMTTERDDKGCKRSNAKTDTDKAVLVG